MSEMWADQQALASEMIDGGWRSPNTYGKEYDRADNFSAVYLFQLFDAETFRTSLIAYVGQTTQLKTRWSGHTILRELDQPGYWVKKWFLRTPADLLTDTELHLIRRFDPPWNVQGRKRGVQL